MSSVNSCLALLSSGPALSWLPSYGFVKWHLVTSLSLLLSCFVLLSFWFYLNIVLPFIYTYLEQTIPFHTLSSGWVKKGLVTKPGTLLLHFLSCHYTGITWVSELQGKTWRDGKTMGFSFRVPDFLILRGRKEWINDRANIHRQTNRKSTKC